MRTTLVVAVLGSTALAAHAEPADETPFVRSEHSCGTHQGAVLSPDIDNARVILAPGAQRVVYLNRFGGTYKFASHATNSAANTANTIASYDGRSRDAVIPPLGSNFDWPMIVDCVKGYYSKVNVRFTETEPSSGTYIEAVVGGNGSEVGASAGAGLLGVASADNFCNVTEAGIAFNFSAAHGNGSSRNRELCVTIAHEIGHLLALEHETLAADIMSYVPVTQQPNKSFVDQFAACGIAPGQAQACNCGGSQTNSAQRLNTYVGPRPVETEKPSLTVESPSNNSTVAPVFEVIAKASDNMAMADVRVLVDGAESGATASATDGRYVIRVSNATLGDHQLTVIARDEAGNENSAQLAVKVAKLTIGESCVANEACEGNLCATGGDGTNFCTQTCDVANDTCPADFECTTAGTTAVCVAVEGGCGCDVQDPREGVAFALTLGFGALVFGRRRRR